MLSNPFSETNEALVLYQTHKNGLRLANNQLDLTEHQKYFLNLMAVEDIKEELNFKVKFDALCKSQGIKFKEDNSRFSSSNSIREQARKRIEERKKRKLEEVGDIG